MALTRAFWTAFVIFLAPARSLASGFSHRMCFLASAAATVSSTWTKFGVLMSIRSMSSRSTSFRQSVSYSSHP